MSLTGLFLSKCIAFGMLTIDPNIYTSLQTYLRVTFATHNDDWIKIILRDNNIIDV